MTSEDFDWIIIGGGGVGCAVAAALSRAGFHVLTLERYGLNHARGSSHGRTRILRTAYSEGSQYVPLVLRARKLWRRIERETHSQLFAATGALVLGSAEGRMVRGALASARAEALPHRLLESSEVAARFPAFRPSTDEVGVWDPKGGVLFPERALAAFVGSAEARGASFAWRTPAKRWTSTGREVTVRAGAKRYSARGLVFAAGAWTSGLLPELKLPLSVERQTVFWYRPGETVRERFRRMPAFVWQRRSRGYFYGTPDFGDGVKVASDVGRPVRDPGRRSLSKGGRERELVEAFVRSRLPLVRGRFVGSVNCLYTNSPDHDFLVDFHPRHSNVIVVSACSGHGFKFLPAVGETVARMAESNSLQPGWESFRLNRWLRPRHPRNV